MGMYIDRMLFLQERGYLTPERNRLLDIGAQNVYHIDRDKLLAFVERHGAVIANGPLEKEIDRLVYFSTPRSGERTTLLSEITDLVGIEYNSFDVCPGLKTDIVDLNFDDIDERHREYYDIVLNFGTTEHVFNQWNCFRIMHDALKVGGVMYTHIQLTGSLEHGYYFYTPRFFNDMAAANNYIMEQFFLVEADFYKLGALKVDVRAGDADCTPPPNSAARDPAGVFIPAYNINAVMRKTQSAPFRCRLEIETAHASPDPSVTRNYRDSAPILDQLGQLQETRARLAAALTEIEALKRS